MAPWSETLAHVRTVKNILHVRGLDAINNTPVLDIKPLFKKFTINEKDIQEARWVDDVMKNYYE